MNKMHSSFHALRAVLFILLPSSFILILPGCTLFGALAGKMAPLQTVQPRYEGFTNQSIAIMVWAGDGTLIDFPDVRSDLAGSLQKKLTQARDAKTKQLAGVTFPQTPTAVVRFQENNPEYEARPLTETAPRLGASRVIYLEIENLQTRSDAAVELFRGSGSVTLKVVEVPPAGSGEAAKVAYEESGVQAVFPPKAREEGTPDGNDRIIYQGLIDALSTEIAKRFVPHPAEE